MDTITNGKPLDPKVAESRGWKVLTRAKTATGELVVYHCERSNLYHATQGGILKFSYKTDREAVIFMANLANKMATELLGQS